MDCIDFHFHSYYSGDAFGDPATYISLAKARGITAIAPTEHDNIDSLAPYREAILSQRARVTLYSGVEIDVLTKRWGHFHIVAYCFDTKDAALLKLLQHEVDGGLRALHTVVKAMNADNQKIDIDAAFAHYRKEYSQRAVGPKAVWKWLHETGRQATQADAKSLYGRYSKEVKSDHQSGSLEAAIKAVHDAGGILSVAHPARFFNESDVDELLRLGIDLVEVYTPSNNDSVAQWEALAHRKGWVMTGGSDNHDAVGENWKGWPTTASSSLLERFIGAYEKRHGRAPVPLV
jgi:predicted metal-dependent phosphoesterase TrpH